MPGGDRTGPMGTGPMTGRAAGFCAGLGLPGYMNPIPGRGFGMGFGGGRGRRGGWGGGGRGWRNWFRATGLTGWQRAGMATDPPTREQQAEFLKAQADSLQAELDDVRKQLDEVQAEPKKG